ncbi:MULTISPECIES: SPFH domain-containing protein [Dactylosporangium]|uniref:Flotillin family protein n=2 Tax=Dactylosporangium TaxID=35753 RepID=A0A9W6NSB5_9ACTN|nr:MULTISPECIES: SPFH domain-containing protein [Dactylosporangium]UAB93006.1 flotillin [Dactylosporangium vinaceum]UWZ41416.1 flotillin [Dactylosporangium matsuzakiense]GLL06972.1 flotillin family protein [Dactylosporangium matsuzakiense]
MFGYRVPAPNEALLISGRKQRGADALPFKIVTGHGAFVVPIFSKATRLTLAMQEAEVEEDCYTQQGLTLHVQAVIAFKVGDDHESIAAAARRFQGDQSQMPVLVGRIFSGHLRSIIGSMTVEAIIREQQTLADAIVDASKTEMARIGLEIDSLQISSIHDKGVGYIKALAAPHQARVNQEANVAQAVADQASAMARQESTRNQAEYARQTAIAQARYQAEIDQAQQTAAQAGPLAAAQAQQHVLAEQALVAQKNAELRQAQLIAEVIRPAQAEAERIVTLARADADATKLSAEAAAAQGRIALDQMMIEQLPDLLRAAAEGLQGANLTVLDGAEGLNSVVASLAAQGTMLLDAVRKGMTATPAAEPTTSTDVARRDAG